MATADEARRRPWPSLVGARPRVKRWSALAVPAVILLVVVFLVPLIAMAMRSVTDPPNAGLANYEQFFATRAYVNVLTNTFWIALLAGVIMVPGTIVARERFVLMVTAIQLAFYIGSYFATPHEVAWHVVTSWSRLTDQIAIPITVVLFLALANYAATPQSRSSTSF